MSMDTREFLERAGCQAEVLEVWVEAGWIAPGVAAGDHSFRDIDVARAQLIHDLQRAFGINDDGVSVVLDLVDRMFGLRRRLGELARAVHAQPETVRREIVAHVRQASPHRDD